MLQYIDVPSESMTYSRHEGIHDLPKTPLQYLYSRAQDDSLDGGSLVTVPTEDSLQELYEMLKRYIHILNWGQYNTYKNYQKQYHDLHCFKLFQISGQSRHFNVSKVPKGRARKEKDTYDRQPSGEDEQEEEEPNVIKPYGKDEQEEKGRNVRQPSGQDEQEEEEPNVRQPYGQDEQEESNVRQPYGKDEQEEKGTNVAQPYGEDELMTINVFNNKIGL